MKQSLSTRKVLFIVYEFPPEGARGTKRTLKFIKFLPYYDWTPLVLTVRNPNYDFDDRSLVDEIPSYLKVYRAATLEKGISRFDRVESKSVNETLKSCLRTILGKFAKSVYHLGKFLVPGYDSRILWLPFAVLKGLQVARHQCVDVLFATGPSFTNHLVGWLLKKISGLPLVMDFRDAWASDPANDVSNPRYERAVRKLERIVIESADKVVSTTEGISRDFVRRYRENSDKFTTITNGYDEEDFSIQCPTKKRELGKTLKIVHAGTLGWERSPKEFLEALSDLVREEPFLKTCVRVQFVGQNTPFRDGKTIHDLVFENCLDDVVEIVGFVTRRKSLEYIAEADLLLVLIGRVPEDNNSIYGISAKIYDYAASAKPALTIAEEGASAEMALRLKLGIVVHPDDSGGIKNSLRQYYQELSTTGHLESAIDMETLRKFDFKNLTRELSTCLEQAINRIR